MPDNSSGEIDDETIMIIIVVVFGLLILVMIGIYCCGYCFEKLGWGKSTGSRTRRPTRKTGLAE